MRGTVIYMRWILIWCSNLKMLAFLSLAKMKVVATWRVGWDSHKWIHAGNQGKTDELIMKKKSRRIHSAPRARSSLPQASLQEQQQEIKISRLFMMCHSCQKLEL